LEGFETRLQVLSLTLGIAMTASFPAIRMRRLRRHDWTRRLVAENTLSAADFIWPIFIVEGSNKRMPVV